jgi:hypothetical protein
MFFLVRPCPRLAACRSGDWATESSVSSAEKSNLRLTTGCEAARSSRSGLWDIWRACDIGATEDCRLGEDPMFVLKGDRPIGGGNTVFEDFRRRRVESTSVGSGTEPVVVVSTTHNARFSFQHLICFPRTLRQIHIRRGKGSISISYDALRRALCGRGKYAIKVLDAVLVLVVYRQGNSGFSLRRLAMRSSQSMGYTSTYRPWTPTSKN